ncbi:MAG: hypothetical protein LBI60_02940 [Bacteroidales bacterium]|jgi:hypothetical protein|nr:hypothetical protein [Bacteroidales bacterium]
MKGIVLDENCNLLVSEGSLVIGDTRYQRSNILIVSHRGEIKHALSVGFGASKWLKRSVTSDVRQRFVQGIESELKADGIKATVTIANGLDLNEFSIETL